MENYIKDVLHVSAADSHSFSRIKVYPGGYVEVMAADRPIFCMSGWEEEAKPKAQRAKGEPSEESIERSRRRAAAKVRDYALSTEFKYFVTFTLDKEQVDRYDYQEIVRRMRTALDNAVRRKGLAYVLVPELHKDGAIHFHGFVNDVPGMVFSGCYTGGLAGKRPARPDSAAQEKLWIDGGAHPVYNVTWWRFGFSSAIPLYGDYQAAVAYVCKYIQKADAKIGGRWYLSGGALKAPNVVYMDVTGSEVMAMPNSYTFSVAGRSFAIWRGKADEAAALLHY